MEDLRFLQQVEEESGENVSACYQCYRCSNGCPAVPEMDLLPHRVIRHVILGHDEKVLKSRTIWACLQCYTCSVRCPNDIHIAHVFDSLRKISTRKGLARETDTWRFNELFLDSVKRHGRLHEIEAIMRYKLAKRKLFDDVAMGLRMILKGRMGFFAHNIKGRSLVRNMFARARETREKR